MADRFDTVKNKNLLVIGLGKTGISVIKKLLDICATITGIDNNPALNVEDAFEGYRYSDHGNLKIILGKNISGEKEIFRKTDLAIISPGVSDNIPIIRLASKYKIPIWSELELAWRLLVDEDKDRTIAVTGTNGKTTVVNLIGKIIDDSGKNCVVCGNVGLPLIDTIDAGNENMDLHRDLIRVIEVSSFQLERVYDFKPHISVILNITSDHIDRHETFENYVDLKLKLLANQNKNDWSIVNADDPNINKRIMTIPKSRGRLPGIIRFGLQTKEGMDLFYENNRVYYRIGKSNGAINIKDILLKGKHNISNIMASIAASVLIGIDKKSMEKTINTFKPLDHRLEYLGYVRGLKCFNDSKSTNPDATIVAVSDFGKEITLIMGGKDKAMDFSELIPVLNKKVKNLILIGETSSGIYKKVTKSNCDYEVYRCDTLEAAVKKGFEVASPGEVLMLSPACASMDMFKDYKDRGNRFKNLIFSKK